MSRPKKQTVDYFPHDCTHRKTMFILEQKYGNDGYAFWFKLLETLGASEGHYIHFVNGVDWEYLMAKTRLDKEKCSEILDLLAVLGAIDKELWHEQIVWSDNFIENIKEAYRNRKVEIPVKPSLLRNKSVSKEINDVINPHIILNETILNKNNNIAIDVLPKQKPTAKLKINFNRETLEWENITETDIEVFKNAYPACDLKIELAQMTSWILGAGAKGYKTEWRSFINTWLKKSQNGGGTDKFKSKGGSNNDYFRA